MERVLKTISFSFILISTSILTSCDGIINAPDRYLNQVLAEAAKCPREQLKILDQAYVYPSTVYKVQCKMKKFSCQELRYGYDLFSGAMYSEMVCIPLDCKKEC